MKYLRIVLLEIVFLILLSLVLLATFGFFAGGKATGEIVADIFIFHQYAWWTAPLAFSVVFVGGIAPFAFNSTNMFEKGRVDDILIGAVVMVFTTLIVWLIALMIVGLLGEFGKIFSKFFSDFMTGLNSRR